MNVCMYALYIFVVTHKKKKYGIYNTECILYVCKYHMII